MKLTNLIGIIKDKASQSKAAISSKPKNFSLNLSLLRATTHDPFTCPNPKHVTTLLSYGHSSRATAAAAIEALMDRLQSTHDSSVAVKCLIIVHHIIKHGSFILQDQLSVYPANGGRNYLKLSSFRDNTTPITWELSSWIRWYAGYLENLLSTSRIMGFFLCSTSSTSQKDKEEEKVSSLTNSDLLKELFALSNLIEEISKRPNSLHLEGNEIVDQIIAFVSEDYLSAINEISIRIYEFDQRLSCLSFGDSVELVCVLKMLENYKEKLLGLSIRKKALVESLWSLISDMKIKAEKIGKEVYKEEGKGRLMITMGRNESSRFTERVLSYGNSVKFSSARYGFNNDRALSFVESAC